MYHISSDDYSEHYSPPMCGRRDVYGDLSMNNLMLVGIANGVFDDEEDVKVCPNCTEKTYEYFRDGLTVWRKIRSKEITKNIIEAVEGE